MIGRIVQLVGYALAAICFFFLLTGMVKWERPKQESPGPIKNMRSQFKPPAAPFDIHGFQFNCRVAGKQNISIQADRFTIRKKKIGFLRIGLLNEVILTNASIKIYGEKNKNVVEAVKGDVSQKENVMSDPQDSSQELVFAEVLSKEMLPSFTMPNVAAISVEPVRISLYDDQNVVTSISANSAAIRLTSQDVQFKGNVRVVSGDRILSTDELALVPHKAILTTKRHFNLRTATGSQKGQRFSSDVFLRHVNFEKT